VDRLLRRSDVLAATAISTSSLYFYMKVGDFPRPIKIGKRAVRWREHEVNDWLRTRPTAM
jgi:prophage regulatory protein